MAFKQFQQDLNEGKLGNVCLLYGEERFLTDWASGEIVRLCTNEMSRGLDMTEYDGATADLYSVVESCETLPVFSEKRLVFIDRIPKLKPESEKDRNDKTRDKEEGRNDYFVKYVKEPSPSTLLVITAGDKVNKTTALYKAIAKTGKIYEFTKLSEKEVRVWIKKRFKAAKKSIGEKELSYLIESSGYLEKNSDYTLRYFENDISKIILLCAGEAVTIEDIDLAIEGNFNRDIFKMIDLITTGNKKMVYNMLDNMLTFDKNIYGILALLWRQYENILSAKVLKDGGRSMGEIMSALKSPDWMVKRWLSVGNSYKEADLQRILQLIHDTDINIKTGLMDDRTALEFLIGMI